MAITSIYEPLQPPSTRNDSSRKPSATIFFISLFLVACVAIPAYIATDGTFNVFPSSTLQSDARHLTKLKRPTVIMISCDGFRFGYQFKTPTPNIHRLIAGGTEAKTGLIPVFPSITFPNHYSIATGLYPAYHGIINNKFRDPITGEVFKKSSLEPHWWLGEPMWVTAANQGVKAATFMWPGSQVKKGSWDCPENFCPLYNGSVPFEERVDTILSHFDLPSEEIPSLTNLYLSDPDSQGHKYGPDHPEITKAVAHVDRVIGRLIQGLEKRGVFQDVNIILLGDHGMVGLCDKRFITLEDLAPWIRIDQSWLETNYPLIGITPTIRIAPEVVVAKMNEGLKSGKVENGEYLKVYLKKDLPRRFHYFESDRIPNILAVADEGFGVQMKRSSSPTCGGAHGYDNAFLSMRTIFIGHGPRFARGRKVPSFENVQIYNMVMSILNIKGSANNGTASVANSILLPSSQ